VRYFLLLLLLTASQSFAVEGKTAFGELEVNSPTPVFQETAVYGLTDNMLGLSSGTGSATVVNSEFVVQSGTDTSSFGFVGSNHYINYRAGEGLLARITADFDTPQTNNRQLAGLTLGENGAMFGYDTEERFGILHRYNGINETRTLTVTTQAGGSETATVTIDDTGYSVSLTAGTTAHNAAEISASLNAEAALLWDCDQIGSEVVCTSLRAKPFTGSFAFSSSTAVASWATDQVGQVVTDDWYYFSQWSEYENVRWLKPQKGNVYQIRMQYLGYGAIYFYVEHPESGEFHLAHTIPWANHNDAPSFSNPAFRLGWSSSNFGANSTNVTLTGASAAAFVEGDIRLTRHANATSASSSNVVSGSYLPILTIRSASYFGGKANKVITYPQKLYVATEATKSVLIRVSKNATLVGSNFSAHDPDDTPILEDTSATSLSGGETIYFLTISAGGQGELDFTEINESIRNGEQITVEASVLSGSAATVVATIVWQDDY